MFAFITFRKICCNYVVLKPFFYYFCTLDFLHNFISLKLKLILTNKPPGACSIIYGNNYNM